MRSLAALTLVAAAGLTVAACDKSHDSSEPAPAVTTSAAPTSASDKPSEAEEQRIEKQLDAMGFKVVPRTVSLIGGAAMNLVASFRLDLGCIVADGVVFTVDTNTKPYTVTAKVRRDTTGVDRSQSITNTYPFTTQPTPEQIAAGGFCRMGG